MHRRHILNGVLVDDGEYWRNRMPAWLHDYSIDLTPVSSYQELQDRAPEFVNNKIVIGDYRIKGARSNGIAALNMYRSSKYGSLKSYFLMSVLSKDEIEFQNGMNPIPNWLTFISKSSAPEFIANMIFEVWKTEADPEI